MLTHPATWGPFKLDRYRQAADMAGAPGVTFADNASMRQPASEVAAALSALPKSAAGIRSPLSAGGQSLVSKDGRSALVTFDVPGNVADVGQAATADLLEKAHAQGYDFEILAKPVHPQDLLSKLRGVG